MQASDSLLLTSRDDLTSDFAALKPNFRAMNGSKRKIEGQGESLLPGGNAGADEHGKWWCHCCAHLPGTPSSLHEFAVVTQHYCC